MKAFIPEIKTELELKQDWTFQLYLERRNHDIYVADKKKGGGYGVAMGSYARTLPAGSRFLVDRIYVRNNAKKFSSVSLKIVHTTDPALTKVRSGKFFGRFWVKLADFNAAAFEVVNDTSISAKPKEDHGTPATYNMLDRRTGRYQEYWVKFEHPDSELSFEGTVQTHRLRQLSTEHPDAVNTALYEHTGSKTYESGGFFHKTMVTTHYFEPKCLLRTLVADTWTEAHKNNAKYQVMVPDQVVLLMNPYIPNVPLVKKVVHPLEDQLHLPLDRKERMALGIKTNKSPLVNIPVAGGKLSIYDITLK